MRQDKKAQGGAIRFVLIDGKSDGQGARQVGQAHGGGGAAQRSSLRRQRRPAWFDDPGHRQREQRAR